MADCVHLDDGTMEELIRRAAGMAILYGVQKEFHTDSPKPVMVEPMPFTLFPSPFSASLLQEAMDVQIHHQTLMHQVSLDFEFMHQCLKEVLESDEFLRNLWTIYATVREEGVLQPLSLGLFRNDYMMEHKKTELNGTTDGQIHGTGSVNGAKNGQNGHITGNGSSETTKKSLPELCLKQVEFNTFASGAGGSISNLHTVHRYNLTIAGVDFNDEQLPENAPTRAMASGMLTAWDLYGNDRAVILFVVGTPEPNHPDQRWLERRIFEQNPKVRVIYRRFDQLVQTATLSDDRRLLVDHQDVAVTYFRHGYSPKHYPTQKEFDLRLLMERSRSIKCPPINLHIAGSKKIQQELARPGCLERFIQDSDVITKLRSTLTGLYSLDEGTEGDKHIELAMASPDQFVLKPQREGGGNNTFGKDIPKKLEEICQSSERNNYILMDRIQPYSFKSFLVRQGLDHGVQEACSELGIFGVLLGSMTSSEVHVNKDAGYLLRTKPLIANESGLFSGHACLDSALLI